MKYGIIIDGDYILAVTKNAQESQITEEEYNQLVSIFRNRPEAPDGYAYMLLSDNHEWELVEAQPPEPDDQIDDSEIADILLGGTP